MRLNKTDEKYIQRQVTDNRTAYRIVSFWFFAQTVNPPEERWGSLRTARTYQRQALKRTTEAWSKASRTKGRCSPLFALAEKANFWSSELTTLITEWAEREAAA